MRCLNSTNHTCIKSYLWTFIHRDGLLKVISFIFSFVSTNVSSVTFFRVSTSNVSCPKEESTFEVVNKSVPKSMNFYIIYRKLL